MLYGEKPTLFIWLYFRVLINSTALTPTFQRNSANHIVRHLLFEENGLGTLIFKILVRTLTFIQSYVYATRRGPDQTGNMQSYQGLSFYQSILEHFTGST